MASDTRDQPGRRLIDEVRFGVLGPVTVTDGTSALNIGGPKQRTVLALLVAHSGGPVSIDSIVDAVWDDDAAPNAKRIVQTYVATLRSVVGDAIVKSGPGWRLVVDRSQVDDAEFEDLYESARDVVEVNPQRASVALREALAMWRGVPYSDVEGHGALEGEVARLSELRVAAQAAQVQGPLPEAQVLARRPVRLLVGHGGPLNGNDVARWWQSTGRREVDHKRAVPTAASVQVQ